MDQNFQNSSIKFISQCRFNISSNYKASQYVPKKFSFHYFLCVWEEKLFALMQCENMTHYTYMLAHEGVFIEIREWWGLKLSTIKILCNATIKSLLYCRISRKPHFTSNVILSGFASNKHSIKSKLLQFNYIYQFTYLTAKIKHRIIHFIIITECIKRSSFLIYLPFLSTSRRDIDREFSCYYSSCAWLNFYSNQVFVCSAHVTWKFIEESATFAMPRYKKTIKNMHFDYMLLTLPRPATRETIKWNYIELVIKKMKWMRFKKGVIDF